MIAQIYEFCALLQMAGFTFVAGGVWVRSLAWPLKLGLPGNSPRLSSTRPDTEEQLQGL